MKNKLLNLALVASLISTVLFGSFAMDIHAVDTTFEKTVSVDLDPNGEITETKNFGDILNTIKVQTPEELAAEFKREIQKAEEKARLEEERKARKEAEERARANMPIEERIRLACEKYDVPFDVVLAIARLETGWFKSHAYIYKNNPGGLSINEVPMAFDTIDEGVDAFVSNLANNYFAIGLTTPELIGQKYCPRNPEWASLVSELMTYGY